MSGKPPIHRLPPLPRLKVKKPIITQEANKCLVSMSNSLQCWSSNGHMSTVCEGLAKESKLCTAERAMGKGTQTQKSNINYHAARLYPKINGNPHD